MESTGKAGCIQVKRDFSRLILLIELISNFFNTFDFLNNKKVVDETRQILEEFGYIFEQRGLVSVKGKGKLMTYYLVGKRPPTTTSLTTNSNSKTNKTNSTTNSSAQPTTTTANASVNSPVK